MKACRGKKGRDGKREEERCRWVGLENELDADSRLTGWMQTEQNCGWKLNSPNQTVTIAELTFALLPFCFSDDFASFAFFEFGPA